jgi:hypothetical protein
MITVRLTELYHHVVLLGDETVRGYCPGKYWLIRYLAPGIRLQVLATTGDSAEGLMCLL